MEKNLINNEDETLRIEKLKNISKEIGELFYTADENDLEIQKMLYDAVVNIDNVYSIYKERYMIKWY